MKRLLLFAIMCMLLSANAAQAALVEGYAKEVTQPDNSSITLYAYGDEFSARMEDSRGYTAVLDGTTKWYCYASLSADGESFVSTGVPLHHPEPSGISPHMMTVQLSQSGFNKSATSDYFNVSERANIGNVKGLVIAIAFKPDTLTITPPSIAELDLLFNQPNYSSYGQYSSVRDYFDEVSCGELIYTNDLYPDVYLLEESWATWSMRSHDQFQDLAEVILLDLDSKGVDFSQYDSNSDGFIDAITFITAGNFEVGMALHPHSHSLDIVLDGVQASVYAQANIGISNGLVKTVPNVGLVSHESGHMLCNWPDLYSSNLNAEGNFGSYGLMSAVSGGSKNPPNPIGYLKMRAGWVEPVVLNAAAANIPAATGINQMYKMPHPDPLVVDEFYIIENRQKSGIDLIIPDSGIAIYHIDESLINSWGIGLHLVEADDNGTFGDGDLWNYSEAMVFDFASIPRLTWKGVEASPSFLCLFAGPPTNMFFHHFLYDTKEIVIEADGGYEEFEWTLTTPLADFEISGVGNTVLELPGGHTYAVEFHEIPLWSDPVTITINAALVPVGQQVIFSNTTNPPFDRQNLQAIGDTLQVSTICALNFDDDEDTDLFLGYSNGASKMLKHWYFGNFYNDTPALLANITNVKNAVWGDTDNDGDMDVFLVRDAGQHLMLEHTSSGLVDVTSDTPGLSLGEISSASFNDVDKDGNLDLFLVRNTANNTLYSGDGDNSFTPANAGDAASGSQSLCSDWADYNGDGYSDVFVSSGYSYGACRQSPNLLGTLSFNYISNFTWSTPAPEGKWADFNNDGLTDFVVFNGYQQLQIYLNTGGSWTALSVSGTPGVQSIETIALADFNNDGYMDIYVGQNNHSDYVLVNQNSFTQTHAYFGRAALFASESEGSTTSLAAADFNGDGSMDIAVGRSSDLSFIAFNQMTDVGNYLVVNLEGNVQNKAGMGLTAKATTSEGVITRHSKCGGGSGQNWQQIHFGLGSATTVTSLEVTWTTGDTTVLTNIVANQAITVSEPTNKVLMNDETPTFKTEFNEPYPNPFNPSTNISFSLGEAGDVSVAIYGVDGRLVRMLHNAPLSAGHHNLVWKGLDNSGRQASSGLYYCRIKTEDKLFTSKMTLLK